DLGDLDGARAAYERALEIFEKRLGPEHPDTQMVKKHLESLG
ncbi:MAG: tetratricopeptide repeat protein, partial [Proteobacteria bacterium]